jgi:peptide/nickel transport system ATP-binding protein
MLELRDIIVRYGTGHDTLTAVDRVSITLPRGGTVGLVGESGSGKSTIARALVGLVPVASGQLLLDGEDVTSERLRRSNRYRRTIQMVFQDPYASLNPRMTVGEAIGEALALRKETPRSQRRAEIIRSLELVGIAASALPRYPHEFSGGQRQRIAIARVLAVKPKLVIMDEITSALDVAVQATILNLLGDLQRELDLSYLYISHDLSVVGVVTDVAAVMYLGHVVEYAPTEQLFAAPRHPYTRALIDSIPRFTGTRLPAPLMGDLPDPRRPPSGCRFHTRCPIGPLTHPERTICKTIDPIEVAANKVHRAACHFSDETVAPPTPSTDGVGEPLAS